MVARSERLTVGDQLLQSTAAATSTISAIREMFCDVMLLIPSGDTGSSLKLTVCQN